MRHFDPPLQQHFSFLVLINHSIKCYSQVDQVYDILSLKYAYIEIETEIINKCLRPARERILGGSFTLGRVVEKQLILIIDVSAERQLENSKHGTTCLNSAKNANINIQLSPEGEVNSSRYIPRREASSYISTALHRP